MPQFLTVVVGPFSSKTIPAYGVSADWPVVTDTELIKITAFIYRAAPKDATGVVNLVSILQLICRRHGRVYFLCKR